jgi:hypothetical protein
MEFLEKREEIKEVKKKNHLKTIVILSFLILGLSLVFALSYYYFYQVIQVTGIINKPSIIQNAPIPLAVLGNLHPVLNCTINEPCKGDWINLSNPTSIMQHVILGFNFPKSVSKIEVETINYSSEPIRLSQMVSSPDFISLFVYESNWTGDDYPWNDYAFRVTYYINESTNDTEFYSNITIESNMIQEEE